MSQGAAPASQTSEVMERAGRLLARHARSEWDLARRLRAAGHDAEEVAAAVARLRDLGLLDDLAFARTYVEERCRRGRGAAAVMAELGTRGVGRDIAEQAVAEVAGDENQRAIDLATRLAPRLGRYPLKDQAARLQRRLAGRGFEPDAVEAALRAVLPPEGWD